MIAQAKSPGNRPRHRPLRLYLAYVLLVGLPLVGLFLIIAGSFGSSRHHVVPPAAPAAAVSMLTFVIELIVIVICARLTGALFRALGQPRVVGEMLAGILLGPSLLGTLAPAVSAALFPPSTLPFLNTFSQLGLVVFMFLIGLRLDLGELKKMAPAALLVSHVSIAVPLFLGVALASRLYGDFAPPSVSFPAFALFMGVAMSITAFPVLARILADRDLLGSPVGTLATASAAVDDVTGWTLLAVVVALVRGSSPGHSLWLTVIGPVVFAGVMIFGARHVLARLFAADRRMTETTVAACILLALTAGAVTEFLGIHLLFGAFLAGAVMPRHPAMIQDLNNRLGSLINVLFLPVFFAFAGLRAHIGLLGDPEMWKWTSLVILAAVAGKLGGSALAALASGIPPREAFAIGTLMNTRGLMELVALNIGLDAGVISTNIYSMMVLMALFTTLMTGPILSLLFPAGSESGEPQSAALHLTSPRAHSPE